MIIETIGQDRQNKLFMAIEKNISSLKRRNISYVITTFSDTVATITLQVNGKRGMVTKLIALSYDTLQLSWIVYSGNKKYTLTTLSEFSSIVRSLIQRVSATVIKI